LRYLQGHEPLACRLPRTNSSIADLAYSRICRKIEPLVGLDVLPLDALIKSVANANILECVGIVQLRTANEPDQRHFVILRDVPMCQGTSRRSH
jgi:hypothetical protein